MESSRAKTIIGLCGRAGAGKDTAANALASLGKSTETLAFADPLRLILPMFGLTPEFHQSLEAKQTPGPLGVSYRQALQVFGDIVRSEFAPRLHALGAGIAPDANILLQSMSARVSSSSAELVLVTDVRSLAEAHLIRTLGGTIVFIDRPHNPSEHLLSQKESLHSSETGVDAVRHVADVTISNSGTLAEFQDRVAALVA